MCAEMDYFKGKIVSFAFGFYTQEYETVRCIYQCIEYLIYKEWNVENHKNYFAAFKDIVFQFLLVFKVLKLEGIVNLPKDLLKLILNILSKDKKYIYQLKEILLNK